MQAAWVRDLVADLRPKRRPARVLYAGAAFWLTSALIHLGVLGLDGWAWEGAVSFRKPLVFSLSFALLLVTVGWVLDRLPDRPRLAGAIAWTFLVSSSIEVGLIALQAWRGRASHFNAATDGDALIFAAMGAMAGVFSLCLVAVLVWWLVRPSGDRLVRLAVTAGLLVVMTGLGVGSWIIQLGTEYWETHMAVPDDVVYGAGGLAKFPHGVAFHGIQLFIVAAVLLRRSALAEVSRGRVLHLIVWSYVAIMVLASAQTITGNAPTDPTIWSAGLVLAVVGIVAGLARIGQAVLRTPRERAPSLTAA
jgi:hypothetical protein